MEQKDVKKAVGLAEKELKEKQIDNVKKLVLKTLEKLETKTTAKKNLEEEIKILKMDIDDLKAGRLDRIQERQEKDEKAKNTSVATIVKEKVIEHHHYDYRGYWYEPYKIIWPDPHPPFYVNYCDTSAGTLTLDNANGYDINSDCGTITSSVAKNFSAGTYAINEQIVHLR